MTDFYVSLQGLHDLTKHVEARYIFLSAVIFAFIVKNPEIEAMKYNSYPKL